MARSFLALVAVLVLAAATFGAAAKVCEELGLAFVELREPGPDGTFGQTDVPKQSPMIREIYSGALVLNSDYSAEAAEADVSSGKCDAVSFGRPYISNPDLATRIRQGAEWAPNVNVPKTWLASVGEKLRQPCSSSSTGKRCSGVNQNS